MKKYLFLLIFSIIFFYPILSIAKNICYLPQSSENSYKGLIKETKTETLTVNNYLVIFFYYNVIDPKLKDENAKFNFDRTIKLAKMSWGESKMSMDDYFNKDGDTKPYILVEFGGTIRNDQYKPKKDFARIATCFDYKIRNIYEKISYFFIAEYYKDIVDSIDSLFTPLLAEQLKSKKNDSLLMFKIIKDVSQ